MISTELNNLLTYLQKMPASPEGDEITATIFKLAADSAALKAMKSRADNSSPIMILNNGIEDEVFEFSQKEILKMPKEFRKFFTYGGKRHRIRKKKNDVYEIRFRARGLNISASSKKLELAKKEFIEKMKAAAQSLVIVEKKPASKPIIETVGFVIFKDFAEIWMETVKKPSIKSNSFADIARQFKNHLLPKFGSRKLGELRPMELRSFLNGYIEEGHVRLALKLYTSLNEMLSCACAEEAIGKNPMVSVPKPDYEAESGTALTKEEEIILITQLFATEHPCRYAMVFLLYTGMRRSELKSATTDGTWITITCAKTRKGKVKLRKIPISPMLRPYMEHFTAENLNFTDDRLSRVVPKFLPEHTTHHLRHTFITRAQECGVPKSVVKLWVGHAADKRDMTESVYTHFTDEFQLKEIEKVRY